MCIAFNMNKFAEIIKIAFERQRDEFDTDADVECKE